MEPFCRRLFPAGQELHSQFDRIWRRDTSAYDGAPSGNHRCRFLADWRDQFRSPQSRRYATGILSTTIPGNPNKHDVKFGYEFRRTTINHVIDHVFPGHYVQTLCRPVRFPERPARRRQPGCRKFPSPYLPKQCRLFIQDSFRATSRLTLNYGVRWDYFGVTGEKNGLTCTRSIPRMAGATIKPTSCLTRTSTTSRPASRSRMT